MLGKLFSRSNLKNQARTYLKHVAIGGSVEEHLFQTPVLARWSSTATASAQREDSWTKLHYRKGLKGNMRAQFIDPREAAEQEPFFVQKTEGCYVYDNNGKKYLDGVSSLFCTNLGGSEPRIIAAATDQLKTLPFYHSIWNSVSKPSLDLAHELLEMFTARKMEKVLFSDCGSEANETQVKLVWYYNNALGRPNKKKIISQKHSYRGATIGTSSLTGIPDVHEGFDLPGPFALQTDDPHYWRNHLKGETEEQFATRLANNLEKLILKQGPETIAAFIAEPVHAAGGVIIPPPTYYEKIQAVLKKYDILFLADEIACGFGRLGTMFGCDKYNIKPDLVSLAKGLSSAYMPIGAVLISPEIAEVIQSHGNKIGLFGHGFTFSGHPVASAVALEAVKIYRERKIDQEVQKISPRFLDGMKYLADSPIVGEVRGVGLLLALEFTENKSPNNIFPSEWKVGQIYQEECKKRGLLVGFRGDLVFFAPPLIISKEEVYELLSTAINALEATEKRVKELKLKQRRQPNLNLIFDCVGC